MKGFKQFPNMAITVDSSLYKLAIIVGFNALNMKSALSVFTAVSSLTPQMKAIPIM